LWCLAAAALFGASTPLSKGLLRSLGPFSLAGLLYLGAAAAVVPFARGNGSGERRRENRWRLAGAVVAGGVLGPVLLLVGLRRTSAASVSLLDGRMGSAEELRHGEQQSAASGHAVSKIRAVLEMGCPPNKSEQLVSLHAITRINGRSHSPSVTGGS